MNASNNLFSPGDIFYTYADNQYHLHKLLAVDTSFECYHVLSYTPIDQQPTLADPATATVAIYHFPIHTEGFTNPVLLTNSPLTANDLIGYHTYLQHTQDPKLYISIANEYYETGNRLSDEKKYHEAIDAYSKAADLFPLFFEAIDNRAFCKMDLGLWEEAIADFRRSLEIAPNSLLAEFSIGECYYKMGDYQNAKRQFEIAHAIDPHEENTIHFLALLNEK